MYFAVSWSEPRLRINQTAAEWTEARTGPTNVGVTASFLELGFTEHCPGGERVARHSEAHLVPGAGDLRAGHLRAAARAQGDVGGEGQQKQDHHLRTGVSWAVLETFIIHSLHHRVRISVSCRMNFDNYPLDKQTCQFQVGSCKCLKSLTQFHEISSFLL